MNNDYEVVYEKNNYDPPRYCINVETTNFSCYQELKDLVTTTIAQYELAESVIGKRTTDNAE